MNATLKFGLIVALLLLGCLVAVAEAVPIPCHCRISCWWFCAVPEHPAPAGVEMQ